MKTDKRELFFLIVITCVAALIRLYQIDQFPPGLHGDEALTGLDALRILREGWIGPYVGSALGQPSGPLYWVAFIFRLFGASLFTVRASMALIGIATVPALYVLARTLFSWRVAVLASIFLTFSYWHLHYSRIAFLLISVPLLEILISIALFRAFTTLQPLNWAIAGLLTGLGIYTYNTYPVFLGAVVCTLIVYGWLSKSKRTLVKPLLLFSGGLLVMAWPLISYTTKPQNHYLSHHRLYFVDNHPNYPQTTNTANQFLFLLKKGLGDLTIFNRSFQFDGVDALGETPLLDPLSGILLVIGLLQALRRLKEPRHVLVLVGFITAFMPVILSLGGQGRRVITALPFVFILVALPGAQIWHHIEERVWRRSCRLLVVLVFGLVLTGSAVYNLSYYFRQFAVSTATRWVFVHDLAQAIQHLTTYPTASTQVYFFSGRWSYNYPTRQFLLPNLAGKDRSREFGEFTLERKTGQAVVYLLMPPYEQLASELQQKYPGGIYYEQRNPNGQLAFTSYYLAATETDP